jgi:hypothetical protein
MTVAQRAINALRADTPELELRIHIETTCRLQMKVTPVGIVPTANSVVRLVHLYACYAITGSTWIQLERNAIRVQRDDMGRKLESLFRR